MTPSKDSIVSRIQDILERHDTIPQIVKDELILLGLIELLKKLEDQDTRLQFLERYKPYLQGLAWAVGIIGGALLLMAITGKLQIVVTP